MEFNYSKLRGRIKEICGTEGEFAKSINRTPNYISRVFGNKTEFSQTDIASASDVLGIEINDIGQYFFMQ